MHATDPVGLDHDYSQNKSTQDGPGVSFGPKSPNSSNYIDFGVIVITEAPPLRVTPAPATGSGGHPGYQREGTSGNTRSGTEPNSKSDPDAYENTLELASNMPGLGAVGTTADAGVFVSSVARGKPKWESAVAVVGGIFLGAIGKKIGPKIYSTAAEMVGNALKKYKTATEAAKIIGNHVAYGSTKASKLVKLHRQASGNTSGVNLAVAIYRRDGKLFKTSIHSSSDLGHSEWHVMTELKKKGVTPDEIVEFFTERSPCDARNGNCTSTLTEFLGDLSKVTWSAPFSEKYGTEKVTTELFREFIKEELKL